MAKVESLLINQKVLAQKLERSIINGKKTSLEKRTLGFYENKIQDVRKGWGELDANDTKIRELLATANVDCTDEYITEDKYLDLEVKYNEYLGELTDGLISKTPQEPPVNNASTSTIIHNNQPQLPRINLPKFTGEYDQWRSFHDLFISLIHNNGRLQPVQKLHYLKSCLSGEAERQLKHIPVTGDDYLPAWEKLKERYENKRLLVNTQLQLLVNQTKITNENSKNLKSLIDTTEECLQQLKMLRVNIESWDPILIYLLIQKLPFITLKLWEEELGDSQELPKYEDLKKFLQTRFRVLESVSHTITSKPTVVATKSYHAIDLNKCPACNESHYVGNCSKFLGMDHVKRKACIKKSGRCFNCFSNKHGVGKCANLTGCRRCKGRHHTLLHDHKESSNQRETYKQNTQPRGVVAEQSEEIPSFSKHVTSVEDNEASVSFLSMEHDNALLATALVSTVDRNGRSTTLRCLIDPGSQSSFITEVSCKRLRLHGKPTRVEITGLNTSQTAWSNREIQLELTACNNKHNKVEVKMLVIRKITELLPSNTIKMKQWQHLQKLDLADPTYWKPGPIDVLLGTKVYAEILQGGIIKGPKEAPIAIKTAFGWILLGNNTSVQPTATNTFTVTTTSIKELSQQLRNFWEIEEVPKGRIVTPEEEKCEQYFNKTHIRLQNGQYQVKLPFINENGPELGESRDMAFKRFQYLQRKFIGNPQLAKDYSKCLNEYIDLNHMEEINIGYNEKNNYYLPHHPVFKESTTTKLRVVFDASAKSKNGKSLNEQMLAGPTIQPKLFATLLKWRKYKISMTADIEKMYRMIEVHPDHRKYQQLIWCDPVTTETKDYRLKTVTFGTAAAPYLAIKTLQQLAKDEKEKWPIAAEAVYTDFYVDDIFTGADTIVKAKILQEKIISLLQTGGFKLRKWASNELKVLTKIILQALWITGCIWDDQVNNNIVQQWQVFKENLEHLTNLGIPRWVQMSNEATDMQLAHEETWWNGPMWLVKDKEHWPKSKVTFNETTLEQRKNVAFSMLSKIDDSWLPKFVKLPRVRAWFILRFLRNFKKRKRRNKKQQQ